MRHGFFMKTAMRVDPHAYGMAGSHPMTVSTTCNAAAAAATTAMTMDPTLTTPATTGQREYRSPPSNKSPPLAPVLASPPAPRPSAASPASPEKKPLASAGEATPAAVDRWFQPVVSASTVAPVAVHSEAAAPPPTLSPPAPAPLAPTSGSALADDGHRLRFQDVLEDETRSNDSDIFDGEALLSFAVFSLWLEEIVERYPVIKRDMRRGDKIDKNDSCMVLDHTSFLTKHTWKTFLFCYHHVELLVSVCFCLSWGWRLERLISIHDYKFFHRLQHFYSFPFLFLH